MRALKRIVLAGAVLAISLPANLAAQRSGVEVWSQTCGNCHMNQPPDRYTADHWASIMTHMKIAANLTDDESEAALEFLQAGARKVAEAEPRPAEGVQVASSDPTFLPISAANGAKIYKKQCIACHGEKGKGDGPAAAAFNPRPSNLADAELMQGLTEEELREAVAEGKGAMPGFASILPPEDLEAVLKYIRALSAED
jgi:mono/diheme cytochrome c family protein